MFIITNFRPEDMPGAKKKAKSASAKPVVAETEASQTVETAEKPTTGRTSRKPAKASQKPSKTDS